MLVSILYYISLGENKWWLRYCLFLNSVGSDGSVIMHKYPDSVNSFSWLNNSDGSRRDKIRKFLMQKQEEDDELVNKLLFRGVGKHNGS